MMFSRIRQRFTYANVAVTLALVFAMSGGAYAAKRYLITSTKQISPSVLKKLKGQTGPAGSAGPAGPQGPAGAKGENGTPGTNGVSGKDGESVTSTALAAKNGHCEEGGAEFTVGGSHTYACNGSPWPAGGTLPKGKSEMGVFSMVYQASASGQPGSSPISFAIPLGTAPEAHYIGLKEELAGEKNESQAIKEGKCKGTAEAPEAAPGNLCVFAKFEQNTAEYLLFTVQPTHFIATGSTGTTAVIASAAAGEVIEVGTWVVTG